MAHSSDGLSLKMKPIKHYHS